MGAEADVQQNPEDQLLQQTLDRQRAALEAASHSSAASAWLRPALQTDQGTQQLLADLEARIAQDSFLQQVQREEAQPSAPPLPGATGGEVVSRDWWQVTEAETVGSQVRRSRCGDARVSCGIEISSGVCLLDVVGQNSGLNAVTCVALLALQVSAADMDSYVVVDRADVVDAIGDFVAAYLATLPEAQNMQPKQLQQALKQAFQVLRGSQKWTSGACAQAVVCQRHPADTKCRICRRSSRAALGRSGGGASPSTAAQPSPTQPSASTQILGKSMHGNSSTNPRQNRVYAECAHLVVSICASCLTASCDAGSLIKAVAVCRLVRALLAAIWTASRVLTGLV